MNARKVIWAVDNRSTPGVPAPLFPLGDDEFWRKGEGYYLSGSLVAIDGDDGIVVRFGDFERVPLEFLLDVETDDFFRSRAPAGMTTLDFLISKMPARRRTKKASS